VSSIEREVILEVRRDKRKALGKDVAFLEVKYRAGAKPGDKTDAKSEALRMVFWAKQDGTISQTSAMKRRDQIKAW
jgi:hypothetical protein